MKPYVFFSILLFLLLVGSLGLNIYSQFQLTELQIKYKTDTEQLQAQVKAQREDKNKIRDLWETQAAENDKLVTTQLELNDRIADYVAEIKKSIRFVNTVPQLLPEISEEKLKKSEEELVTQQQKLEEATKTNSDKKSDIKDEIDNIYLKSNETQSNRANPRS